MKHIKPFKLYEADPWDNSPSAPFNMDSKEPKAYIEYPESKRDFVVLVTPGDNCILRRKSDGSLWVLDTEDIADDYHDYLYYYPADDEEDDGERAEGYEDEEYGNIATSIINSKNFIYLGGYRGWKDRGDEMRLFKIDLPLASVLMGDYSTKSGEEYRKADRLLSRFAESL
jgi:hypothetical protein